VASEAGSWPMRPTPPCRRSWRAAGACGGGRDDGPVGALHRRDRWRGEMAEQLARTIRH